MAYYYFSKKEQEYQRKMGLKTTCILTRNGLEEFTTTTDYPVHSDEHRLVFQIEY